MENSNRITKIGFLIVLLVLANKYIGEDIPEMQSNQLKNKTNPGFANKWIKDGMFHWPLSHKFLALGPNYALFVIQISFGQSNPKGE